MVSSGLRLLFFLTLLTLSFHMTECADLYECMRHCEAEGVRKCSFIKIPDPEQCDKFCFCGGVKTGIKVRMDCNEGQAFDPALEICIDRNLTSCDAIPPSGYDCAERGDGLYSYPGRCDVFVQCGNGIEYIHRCLPSLQFDQTKQRCVWPGESDCSQQTTTPLKTTLSTAKPSLPTTGLPPTTALPTTVIPNTTTSDATTLPTRPPRCQDGRLYPDRHSCSHYYQCSNGKLHRMTCPGDLHWSESREMCDFPEAAGCAATSRLHGFRKERRRREGGCPFGRKLERKTMSCVYPSVYVYRQLDVEHCRAFEARLTSP